PSLAAFDRCLGLRFDARHGLFGVFACLRAHRRSVGPGALERRRRLFVQLRALLVGPLVLLGTRLARLVAQPGCLGSGVRQRLLGVVAGALADPLGVGFGSREQICHRLFRPGGLLGGLGHLGGDAGPAFFDDALRFAAGVCSNLFGLLARFVQHLLGFVANALGVG